MGGISNIYRRALIFGVAAWLSHSLSIAAEPRALAGRWERVGETGWLLRDSASRSATALLQDSFMRLTPSGAAGIIQGNLRQNGSGLPVVVVEDVSPEFWAQPSVWRHFQRGPSAYSGFGKDAGPNEWAGRPALDRRAYALDPGQDGIKVLSPATQGVGLIQIRIGPRTVTLSWHARPGRVYVLESTAALGQLFQPVQTISALEDGTLTLQLPRTSDRNFYRVAEQIN